MSVTVWIAARTLNHPNAGGHFWVYLNWAEGLRANGCDLVGLEPVPPTIPIHEVPEKVASLKNRLKPYGLADCVALCPWTDELFSPVSPAGNIDLEAIAGADLLLNLTYGLPSSVVRRFRRSALLDIDPGLTQIWISKGQMSVPRHHLHLTRCAVWTEWRGVGRWRRKITNIIAGWPVHWRRNTSMPGRS